MGKIVDLNNWLRRVETIWCRVKSVHTSDLCFIGTVASLTLLSLYSFPSFSQGTIVHDPVMVRQDSTWYLFCTGKGISMLSSTDLKQWQCHGPVFSQIPGWTHEAVAGFKDHIWAPDIAYIDGTYYLYYAISAFAKNTSCIGLATNKTLDESNPDYKWIDAGKVLQSVPGRDMWNAIDPSLVIDEKNTPWMVFGSFWEGIKLVKLNATYDRPAQPEEWHTVARRTRNFNLPDEDPGDAAIEAPFIFHKNGYYYLFVSYDYCCRGKESNYKIMVGRSKSVTGPYLDKQGIDMFNGGATPVVVGNSDWPGVGHNAVYTYNGKDIMIFHAYDAGDEGRPKLMIRNVSWDDDNWPVVTL
jgi:arabinan endo-1,5-alpha-L-arabinosidase